MNSRCQALLISIAIPLCMTTTVSSADTQTAMSACVKAFVRTSLSQERPITVLTEDPATSRVIRRGKPYSIALTATSRTSGKQLATATCNTDGNGTVVALNGKALPAVDTVDSKASLAAAK